MGLCCAVLEHTETGREGGKKSRWEGEGEGGRESLSPCCCHMGRRGERTREGKGDLAGWGWRLRGLGF